MTSAVNKVFAIENTTNLESDSNKLKTTANSTTEGSNTASFSSDDVSYSVVDVDEAPKGYDDMKNLLHECITSYNNMADYVENLKGKNENLFVQINAKSAEITDISTDDGTGSRDHSAYSLDFQDEKTDDGDKSKAQNTQQEETEKKETQKTANIKEIQAKIDVKQSEVEGLNNTASDNSDKLNSVKQDMGTNQDTIDKIMEKIGEDTSHINGMMRYANAGAVGGGAAGLDPVSSTVASVFGFSSIFGGGKAKKRAEVKQLGKEAYRAEREVSRAVQQCSNTLTVNKSLADDANNKLKEKQSAIETK